MRKILSLICCSLIMVLWACNFRETIKGNGNIVTEIRPINAASKISARGFFDIDLVYGENTEVKIEADENLQPYIEVLNEDGQLILRTKNGYNISTKKTIKAIIMTPTLRSISLSGSGNVKSNDKFSIADKLALQVTGVGSIDLQVNCPDIEAKVSGSGDILLAGESKNCDISISGIGAYKASKLMAENVKIKVSGSGDAEVYAENNLDVKISGLGSVRYKGNALITKHISGSGDILKME